MSINRFNPFINGFKMTPKQKNQRSAKMKRNKPTIISRKLEKINNLRSLAESDLTSAFVKNNVKQILADEIEVNKLRHDVDLKGILNLKERDINKDKNFLMANP